MIGVGIKIKKIRELKNYTQDYMAEQLGMAQSSYNRYENLETDIKLDMLQQIAKILEVTPEQIMEFDEKMVFNNHGTVNENVMTGMIENYSPTFHHYTIDVELKKLYEEQIALLKEKIAMLEKELGR